MLHERQREVFARFDASEARRFVWCSTRRGGKSFAGCVRAISRCIRTPGYQFRYAAPTQVMARGIVYPHVSRILADCPESLRPKVNRMEMTWSWPNGSVLKLAGCDGANADRLRGGECHEAFVDEAGFVDDLRNVVEDVLMPMTLTTNGRIMLASTPPISPAHAFAEYVGKAAATGDLYRYTIYDAPHIPREKADEYVAEAGGPESPTARREYFAEIVIDESHAIVPEFSRVKSTCVVERTRPDYFDAYVSADFGFHDLTVVLFAYYDFARARIVVEDEIAMQGASGLDVGAAVARKERELWGHDKRPSRVADAPQQMLADLAHRSMGPGVSFGPARKDDAEAALNQLRMDIGRGRIEIHPRCKTLIAHLEYGTWNAARTSYDRAEGFGHWDAIDALKYMLRAIPRTKNPEPLLPPGATEHTHHIPAKLRNMPHRQARDLARAFGRNG